MMGTRADFRVILASILWAWVVASFCLVVTMAQAQAAKSNAAAVARGKSIFQQKCGICHNDTSSERKVGPGLKGINKRGTFSVNRQGKITNQSLTTWIENGDALMPGMKQALDEQQIEDVVAYVKTL
jgi:cytochrome c